MKFSPDEVINHIRLFEKENNVKFPAEDVINIAKTYDLAYEYNESKLQEGEVIPYEMNKSMIDYIAVGRTHSERGRLIGNPNLTNETFEEMSLHFSDVSHMNYYDLFFGYGETEKILKALYKHNIPVNALKGVKANEEFKHREGKYYIYQDVFKPDDGSPELLGFSITNLETGETIYEWKPDTPAQASERVVNKRLDEYAKQSDYNFFKEPMGIDERNTFDTREVAKKKTSVSINVDGENITVEGYLGRKKNGETYKIIRYKNSKNQFMKKPQGLL